VKNNKKKKFLTGLAPLEDIRPWRRHQESKSLTGFTLIELLLVLAIIVLLASLIVVYIGQTRARAQDGGIRANLTQVRYVATFVYEQDNSFQNLCAKGTLNNINPNLNVIEKEVMRRNGRRNVVCYASRNKFCVQSPLASAGYFCIDSTGRVTSRETNCDLANLRCP